MAAIGQQSSPAMSLQTLQAAARLEKMAPEYPQASYYRARYYDANMGRFLSEDRWDRAANLYAYVGNSPAGSVDPFGFYTLQSPVPTPVPPALDKFLTCLEGCVGVPITVSSTTNGLHADKGHALGTSVDVKPPAGIPAKTVFCCGGKCGAPRGLNEVPSQAGERQPTTTGDNYHFSLVQYLKHPLTPNAIPPECKPGTCPASKSGPPSSSSGDGLSSSPLGSLISHFVQY